MITTMRASAAMSASAHNQFVRSGGATGTGNLFPTLDNRYMTLYLDKLLATADRETSPVVLLRGCVVLRMHVCTRVRVCVTPLPRSAPNRWLARQQDPARALLLGLPLQPLARVARL